MFFIPMQGVNFENDWKLVTIYVGTSDLCEYCNNQVSVLEGYVAREQPHVYSRHSFWNCIKKNYVLHIFAGQPVTPELCPPPYAQSGHVVRSGEVTNPVTDCCLLSPVVRVAHVSVPLRPPPPHD